MVDETGDFHYCKVNEPTLLQIRLAHGVCCISALSCEQQGLFLFRKWGTIVLLGSNRVQNHSTDASFEPIGASMSCLQPPMGVIVERHYLHPLQADPIGTDSAND